MIEGKRYFYIINCCSDWEGLENRTILLTSNKQDAIRRFKWLYEHNVPSCMRDDNGEPTWDDRNISFSTGRHDKKSEDPNFIRGMFWYTDYEGQCYYTLETIHTGPFAYNGSCNTFLETTYSRFCEAEDTLNERR